MLEWLVDQFSLQFVSNFLLAAFFLSLALAPLSIFVIQRRLSLAGEALAHGTLPGVWLAFIFYGLSPLALTLGGYGAALTLVALGAALSWRSLFRSDALLGGLYITFFSVGGILVSSNSTAINLQEFLVGTSLGVDTDMITLSLVVTLISLVIMGLIYRPLALQTQDPAFFISLYPHGWWVTQGFMAVFVLVLITAVNAFGTLMAIALAILPALAARCWINWVPGIMALSFLYSFIACVGGLLISLLVDFAPTGPTIVLVSAGIWGLSYLCAPYGLRQSLHHS